MDATDALDARRYKRGESEDTLRVLQALKKNPEMTQRDLARMVGISLGKANFILKSLIHKGLVKTHNFKNSNNKKAYIYILTPSGIEEKARITYRFLKRKIQEYERLEEQIRSLRKEVGDLETVSKTETGSSR